MILRQVGLEEGKEREDRGRPGFESCIFVITSLEVNRRKTM